MENDDDVDEEGAAAAAAGWCMEAAVKGSRGLMQAGRQLRMIASNILCFSGTARTFIRIVRE